MSCEALQRRQVKLICPVFSFSVSVLWHCPLHLSTEKKCIWMLVKGVVIIYSRGWNSENRSHSELASHPPQSWLCPLQLLALKCQCKQGEGQILSARDFRICTDLPTHKIMTSPLGIESTSTIVYTLLTCKLVLWCACRSHDTLLQMLGVWMNDVEWGFRLLSHTGQVKSLSAWTDAAKSVTKSVTESCLVQRALW